MREGTKEAWQAVLRERAKEHPDTPSEIGWPFTKPCACAECLGGRVSFCDAFLLGHVQRVAREARWN